MRCERRTLTTERLSLRAFTADKAAALEVLWKGAVLRYAEGELSLTEIWAGADPPNAESFRVMERLGLSFREELVIGGRTTRYFATSVIT